MVLLDAYGLIALVRGEPGGAEVRELLGQQPSAVTTANLAEAYDTCERVWGVARDALDAIISPLLDGPIRAIPLSTDLALRAAAIRTANYDRRERALSLADCILLASAEPGDSIATADRAVLDVASAGGLDTIDLS